MALLEQLSTLEHKVSETGAQLVKVNPAYTTQTCSNCGNIRQGDNKVQLNERTYKCPVCDLDMDRDLNAAINIHRAGLARIHACGDDVRLRRDGAVVVEAGTTRSAPAEMEYHDFGRGRKSL